MKTHGLKLTQNPYTLVMMKDLMKTPLPQAASTRRNICKNPRKQFQRVGILLFFKNQPTFNFMNGVNWQKKALNKGKSFVIKQQSSSLARMKDQLKNTIQVDQKTASI